MKYLRKLRLFEGYYEPIGLLTDYLDRFADENNLIYLPEGPLVGHIRKDILLDNDYNGYVHYKISNTTLFILIVVNEGIDEEPILDSVSKLVTMIDDIHVIRFRDDIINIINKPKHIDRKYSSFQDHSGKGCYKINVEFNIKINPVWESIITTYNKKGISDYEKGQLEEDMSNLDPNEFIQDLYQKYLYGPTLIRSEYKLNVLGVLKDKYPIITQPIRLSLMKVRHGLSQQFVFVMVPIFLKKLYKETGMICKFGYWGDDNHNFALHKKKGEWREDKLTPYQEIEKFADDNGLSISDILVKDMKYW